MDPLFPQIRVKIDYTGTLEAPEDFEGTYDDVSDDNIRLSFRVGPHLDPHLTRPRVLPNVGDLHLVGSRPKYSPDGTPIPNLLEEHLFEVREISPRPAEPEGIYETYARIDAWGNNLPTPWVPRPSRVTIPAYTDSEGTAHPERTLIFDMSEATNLAIAPLFSLRSYRGRPQLQFNCALPVATTSIDLSDLVFRLRVGNLTATINGSIFSADRIRTAAGFSAGWYQVRQTLEGASEMAFVDLGNMPYNYSVKIWRKDDVAVEPLLFRGQTARPEGVIATNAEAIMYPLHGFLHDQLESAPAEPPATGLNRSGGVDVLFEVGAAAGIAGIEVSPHLAQAILRADGVRLGDYQTPGSDSTDEEGRPVRGNPVERTIRRWLRGLSYLQGIILFEDRQGRLDYMPLYERTEIEADVSDLERPTGGLRPTHPTSRRVIYEAEWAGDDYFGGHGNIVNQLGVRYAASSTGFTQVTGGTETPLESWEVLPATPRTL